MGNDLCLSFARQLSNYAAFKRIVLTGGTIGDPGVTALCHALCSDAGGAATKLAELDLSGNMIVSSLAPIATLVSCAPCLDALSLQENPIANSEENLAALAALGRHLSRRRHGLRLLLWGTPLANDHASQLSTWGGRTHVTCTWDAEGDALRVAAARCCPSCSSHQSRSPSGGRAWCDCNHPGLRLCTHCNGRQPTSCHGKHLHTVHNF